MSFFEHDHLSRVPIDALRLLDGPPEKTYDAITRLTAAALNVPVALLSIVDHEGERQFFKSQTGLAEPWAGRRETPLTHSFCQYVAAMGATLAVPDAREDEILSDNLAIHDLGVIAYLGAPVHLPDGKPIGAVCAIQSTARAWTTEETSHIETLADCATRAIWLRAAFVAGDSLVDRHAQSASAAS